MSIKLYNTLTGALEPFVPIRPGEVGIYVCGPTVYDHAHIGHARSAVLFDVIVRYLRHTGLTVRYVRNFTDIDDNILEQSGKWNVSPKEIAETYMRSYREDMETLGCLAPDFEPRVTEHIAPIRRMIARLLDSGNAYVQDGSVYYRVHRQKDYGLLSAGTPAVDTTTGKTKEDESDFVLWKKATDDEMAWESPWGKGRPGWHIECVAMSQGCLGHLFDIHGGGRDLIFPHHENERVIARSLTETNLANYWLHHELVTLNGRKISKSVDAFYRIRDLCLRHHPESVRLLLLSTHYRRPLDFTERRIEDTLSSLRRLYGLIERSGDDMTPDCGISNGNERLTSGFREAMDRDFNIPEAIAQIFASARRLNRSMNHTGGIAGLSGPDQREIKDLVSLCRNVLGILCHKTDGCFDRRRKEKLCDLTAIGSFQPL